MKTALQLVAAGVAGFVALNLLSWLVLPLLGLAAGIIALLLKVAVVVVVGWFVLRLLRGGRPKVA